MYTRYLPSVAQQKILSNLAIVCLIFKQNTPKSESQWRQLTQLPVMNHKKAPLGVCVSSLFFFFLATNSIFTNHGGGGAGL